MDEEPTPGPQPPDRVAAIADDPREWDGVQVIQNADRLLIHQDILPITRGPRRGLGGVPCSSSSDRPSPLHLKSVLLAAAPCTRIAKKLTWPGPQTELLQSCAPLWESKLRFGRPGSGLGPRLLRRTSGVRFRLLDVRAARPLAFSSLGIFEEPRERGCCFVPAQQACPV